MEIPNCIFYGGSQRIVAHRLADGKKAVEVLGPDENDIWFSGVFSGPDAEARARTFDSLRQSGTIVPLVWQSFRYDVLLRVFKAVYASPWWISYTVGFVVIDQPNTPPSQVAAARAIEADVRAACDILPHLTSDRAGGLTPEVPSAAVVPGTNANAAMQESLRSAIAALDIEITSRETTLALTPAADAAGRVDASQLGEQLAAAASLTELLNARSYLRRARLLITLGNQE